MTAHEILKRAYELIRSPESWTTGVDWRLADGTPSSHLFKTEKWSLAGALRGASFSTTNNDNNGPSLDEAMKAIHDASNLQWVCHHQILTVANLSHSSGASHGRCLDALRDAIAATTPKLKKFAVQWTPPELPIEATTEEEAVAKARDIMVHSSTSGTFKARELS